MSPYENAEVESLGGVGTLTLAPGRVAPLFMISPKTPDAVDRVRRQLTTITEFLPRSKESDRVFDGQIVYVTVSRLRPGKWRLELRVEARMIEFPTLETLGFLRANHHWEVDASDHEVDLWYDHVRVQGGVFLVFLPHLNAMPDLDCIVMVPGSNIIVRR